MKKIIASMLIASMLVTAIGAGLLQSSTKRGREKELFNLLNNVFDAEKAAKILEQVDVGERDNLKIVGCRVSDIMSYQDTSCTLKRLIDPEFLANTCKRAERNRGLDSFIRLSIERRTESCTKNFYTILNDALGVIEARDKEIVQDIELKPKSKKLFFGRSKNSADKSVEDQRFNTCVRLIHRLSFMSTFNEWRRAEFDDEKRDFIMKWYGSLERCRRYVEIQCEPYYEYFPVPGGPAWHRKANFEFDEMNPERAMQCIDIIHIVTSDETEEKSKADSDMGQVRGMKNYEEEKKNLKKAVERRQGSHWWLLFMPPFIHDRVFDRDYNLDKNIRLTAPIH